MNLETGKAYRAKTIHGDQIVFTVVDAARSPWITVELEDGDTVEPNVSLNTGVLLWISSEQKRKVALTKAADQVIEALEQLES